MTHRSPLVSLAGLVAAFAVMFGVNFVSSAPAAGGPPSTAASTSSPPAATLAPTPDPSPTVATPSAVPSPTPSVSEPDSSEFPGQVVYAGRTQDGSIAIAIAVLGDQAAAYLCDGSDVESWLRGSVEGNTVTLRSKSGDRLEAELDGNRLKGEIAVSSDRLDFRVAEAKKPAGLYRAKGAKTTVGWIVLPDGSQVGIQTTGSESTPAPELDPSAPQVEVDGETLEPDPISGDENL